MAGSVRWHEKEVSKVFKERQSKALRMAGAHLERMIKLSMVQGTGKEYEVGGKKVRRSAPGKPPAVDTGRLRSSITWQTSDGHGSTPTGPAAQSEDKVSTPPSSELTVRVGTSVEYAAALELGAPKILPRPFLRPGLENNRAQILKFFRFR